MQKQPLHFRSSSTVKSTSKDNSPNDTLALADLENAAREWLFDCQYRQHSPRTIVARRIYLDKLIWFLKTHNYDQCGVPELRRFFAYLTSGHEQEGGRWGNSLRSKPVRPSTVATYHSHIRAFFNWLVGENFLDSSPMERIAPPISRSDQVQPFSLEQVKLLILAARRTRNADRDEAIVRFLLDTGMRASELCGLRMESLDLFGQRAFILGKGNKHRAAHFGSKTARALRNYLRMEQRSPTETLFQADKNQYAGQPLTPNGLRQLIANLGQLARLQAVRCSPHTLRHTFAVEFLRNGGNVFSLKEILGHSSLHMTNRYVALAQADIEQQYRQFAPGDRLGA